MMDVMEITPRISTEHDAKKEPSDDAGSGNSIRARITRIRYNEQEYSEDVIVDVDETMLDVSFDGITWIDAINVADVDTMQKIGQIFNLHPVVIEDIMDTEGHPKIIDDEQFLLLDFNVFFFHPEHRELKDLQHCVLFTKTCIFTFQEGTDDYFRVIKDRLKNRLGILRKMGPDFLLYTILDYVVDSYFAVMDQIEEIIDDLENDIVTAFETANIAKLQRIKRDLIFIRKSIWPVREIVNRLETVDISWISKATRVYLRSLYDHIVNVIDIIETSRDILASAFDIYLSSQGNKLNNIVKILTIISVIFIPLNFITGFFGMNWIIYPYEHEPLNYIGMVCVICTMVLITYFVTKTFRKRKWL
jgi:magnesium transporter